MQRGSTIAERFELEELLGSGGMGEVYSARDKRSGERVALKVLTAEGPLAVARFQREGALLARLTHPGIVRFVAAGTTDGDQRYLAMEWLEGEDLAARLDRGALSIGEAVALIADVGRALGVLHGQNIVHRDVKPSNVFLVGGSVRRPKLLDFGIARPMPSSDRVTKTGAGDGTIGYMAPEQVRGDSVLDARCDVFALGCVLFECLTGRPPFVGEHALAILTRIVLEPAPAPSDLCPGVPPALDDLVARMLARDREGRPADASEVVAELTTLEGMPKVEIPSAVETTSAQALAASQRRMVMAILGEDAPSEETLSPEEMEQLQRSIDQMESAAAKPSATVDGIASTRAVTTQITPKSPWPRVVAASVATGAVAAVLWWTLLAAPGASRQPAGATTPDGASSSAVHAAGGASPVESTVPPARASASSAATSSAQAGSAHASPSALPVASSGPVTPSTPPRPVAPAARPPAPAPTVCSGLDCF